MDSKLLDIVIDGNNYKVPKGITLIQACEIAGIEIPRFCYHERLKIAGNCRMCLIEIEGGPPKPMASCAIDVSDGIKIRTDSKMVKKAREGVMEFLLINHPLDCPICDQGGECDLQDQAFLYGNDTSDYNEKKRSVTEKLISPFISTHMNRCIHCTRCVRFMDDVAGVSELGAINRGEDMEITTFLEKGVSSEMSGNIIDLCPVGALTSKPYAFKARPWELKKTESIDIMDSIGSNIRIDVKDLEVVRILPRINEEINEEWISNKTRFCYDGLKYQRLDQAYIRKHSRLTPVSLDEAYKFISDNLAILKSQEIGALAGNLADCEEIYALKTLMSKLGSDNIDCRPVSFNLDSDDKSSYIFNTPFCEIEKSDYILLINVDPSTVAPIINSKIRKAQVNNDCEVKFLGSKNIKPSYYHEYLGNKAEILVEILNEKHSICKNLKEAKKPLLIMNAMDSNILNIIKAISDKYFIKNNHNGFNMLHDNISITGALDLNFVSNDKKINTETIIQNIKDNKIKLLYLLGVDDGIDFGILKDSESLIIYQGSHGDNGANIADVILPSAAYTEKESTYINNEARAQSSEIALMPPQNAYTGWKIILQLAKAIGLDLEFCDFGSLRNKLNNISNSINNLDVVVKREWKKENSEIDFDFVSSYSFADLNKNPYNNNVIARNSKILTSSLKYQ